MISSRAMVRRAFRLCAVPAICAALACAGCGPITYHSEVSRRAERAVEAARAAEAERYAPYWFTRATEYLHQAHAVAAHADFQGANRFGRLATESALQAKADAEVAARDPSKRPRDAAPVPTAAPKKPGRPAPVQSGAPRGLAPAKEPP